MAAFAVIGGILTGSRDGTVHEFNNVDDEVGCFLIC
jgi:hypothetical protein